MLGAAAGGILEAIEVCGGIARERYVYGGVGVIPSDFHSKEQCSTPVGGDLVQFFQGREEMVGVGPIDVLDAKIIDNEIEVYTNLSMHPQACCMHQGA